MIPRENVVHEPAITCPAPPLGERVQMWVSALETAIEPVRPWPYHSIPKPAKPEPNKR